jgi:hypothetical protein
MQNDMVSSLTKSTLQIFGVAVGLLVLFLTAPEPVRGQEIDQTVARWMRRVTAAS